jgi:hypothetical protein
MNIKKISEVKKRYYKLLLLAGKHSSGKTNALKKVQQHLKSPLINLNFEISNKLQNVDHDDQGTIFDTVISELSSSTDQPILIDNTEILFSPEFQLNPLQILKRISRTRVVIASWSGTYSNGQLIHGDINDDEYFVAKGAEIEDIEIYSLPEFG